MEILLGCDPEVFVRNSGVPVSAHKLIPGTKVAPYKVKDGAVQVDGHALEFNIHPADSEASFLYNIQQVMQRLQDMLPPNHGIDIVPSMRFDWEYLKSLPAEANELGCDPDYNAYTGEINPRPDGATNLRTAAGHIHIGWTKDAEKDDPAHVEKCRTLVRQLDFFLGIPSVILDQDKERRTLYGCAGAYRIKPYGVEYRVLSNFWLKSPALTRWVYNQTHLAIRRLLEGEDCYRGTNEYYPGKIINTSDLSELKRFRETYEASIWGMIDTFEHLVEE